ncbi:alpha/beta fold hydrolase [soil metagenome]
MTEESIMQGAEPFFFPGNDIGVLACHGFTGTTQSMRYLGEQLNAAGYTVIGPRLKGHGISPQAMGTTTASDWIASVDAALAELRGKCSEVYMTGLSMGGTLTLYTAAKHAGVIKGAIPINAVVHIGKAEMASIAFDASVPETVPGIGSDVKDATVTELAYKEVPTAAFRQVYALAAVTQDLLPSITCPTLMLQSREDHVVNPTNGPRIAGLVGSARVELNWLDNSYHVATIDFDKELIAQKTIAFIRSIAGR